MQAVPFNSKAISSAVKQYTSAAHDLQSDRTEDACRQALAAAESAAEAIAVDDPSIAAEAMIDAQLEATRNLQVSKLRLQRAERENQERRETIDNILKAPAAAVIKALCDATPRVQAKLTEDLRALLGNDYNQLANQLGGLAYQRARRLTVSALHIEESRTPADLAANIIHGVELLEAIA